MWALELEPDHSLPTIATEFRKAGYSANFMGKWHVSAKNDAQGKPQLGWLPPGPTRGGFDDLWEGANITELVSHPNEGNYYADDGTDLRYHDEYRVDFIAGRACQFIEKKHDKPWFLFLSQLEPHQQNDMEAFVAPDRYAKDYRDAFVPHDLRNLPGDWRSHLQGYYGCVQAIDDSIGKIVDSLKRSGQLENTVICFFSDHGCTFRTRIGEYKRCPHDSAIRVPFILAGPGFDRAAAVSESGHAARSDAHLAGCGWHRRAGKHEGTRSEADAGFSGGSARLVECGLYPTEPGGMRSRHPHR